MVVPIVAGGALLAFIAWGEDVFGKQTLENFQNFGVNKKDGSS